MRKLLLTSASLGVLAMASTGTALACDPDYSGVELTATTQTGPYIASALQLAAKGWEEKTCGKVKV
ncbi:MAG: extracellular solute-binding protein, partial [Ensifer adhaerens]